MPWTVADVDKHKKGLTPAQKKKWVKIANKVLADCEASGGTDCEGRAIRVANSKFSEIIEEMKMNVPKGALHLVDLGNDCQAFAEGDGETPKKLRMKIYSGKILNHWYWNKLAIDLSGIQFNQSKYPILEDHYTSRKIAFTGKPIINADGIHVNPETTTFVSTKESEEFQRLSSEGFPYQASIYAKPSIIEKVEEGDSVEVNGYKFKGPGSVWRKSEFQEGSVCVFGVDKQTQSSAFSKTEQEEIEFEEITKYREPAPTGDEPSSEKFNEKEVKTSMDLNELKTKYPNLVTEIQDTAVAAFKAESDKEKNALVAQVNALKTDNEAQQVQILSLEKKEMIRTENELKLRAETIWNQALAASQVSERLYDKVKPHVTYAKFVKDDVLDEAAFTEAVKAEIKDWEGRGATGSVMGGGYQSKDDIDSTATKLAEEKKQDGQTTNFLLKLAGEKVNET